MGKSNISKAEKLSITKAFRSKIALDKEFTLLKPLGDFLLAPKLLEKREESIISAFHESKTFLWVLESVHDEESLIFAKDAFSKLALWLWDFQAAAQKLFGKSIVLTDFHLRNFLLTENGNVLGIDFESWELGEKAQNAASLLVWLDLYNLKSPQGSKELKAFLQEEILRQYALKAEALNRLMAIEEGRIALRRKTQPLINQTTAVILAGGESSRMGYTPKISLMLGDYSFGEQILYSLQCFDKVFLSLRESTPQKPLPLPVLTDIIPDIGAIGGIYTSLSLCKTPFVFVVPSDTPFVTEELIRFIFSQYQEGDDCVIPIIGDKCHPLLGIYKKTALPVIEGLIKAKNYRIMSIFPPLKTHYVSLPPSYSKQFQNINTPEEYKAIK